MPIPATIYPNTSSAAHALHRWINSRDIPMDPLTARPWNRYDATNTEWWLIPSSDWPAFRFGKFFFQPFPRTGRMFCGLYLEKGLDPAIAAAYPRGKKFIMNEDWNWHRLMHDMRAGRVSQAAAEAAQRNRRPPLLVTDGGFVEDPGSYDPQAPPMDWNTLQFHVEPQGLQLIEATLSDPSFRVIQNATTLEALPDLFDALPHRAWTWINLYIGYELAFGPLEPEAPPRPGRWDAGDIWRNCLAPWAKWVV